MALLSILVFNTSLSFPPPFELPARVQLFHRNTASGRPSLSHRQPFKAAASSTVWRRRAFCVEGASPAPAGFGSHRSPTPEVAPAQQPGGLDAASPPVLRTAPAPPGVLACLPWRLTPEIATLACHAWRSATRETRCAPLGLNLRRHAVSLADPPAPSGVHVGRICRCTCWPTPRSASASELQRRPFVRSRSRGCLAPRLSFAHWLAHPCRPSNGWQWPGGS